MNSKCDLRIVSNNLLCWVVHASYAFSRVSVCHPPQWLGRPCCQPNNPPYRIGQPEASIDFLDRCPRAKKKI